MPLVWLTGLPATGKSTVARHLRTELASRSIPSLVLDGDEIRALLISNPSYSDDERDHFYRILKDLAVLIASQGTTAIVAATAPRRHHREAGRAQVDRFVEVFLTAPSDLLETRDPKGLYARAKAGQIDRLPGRGTPYETPEHPELTFDTSTMNAGEIATRIAEFMVRAPSLDARADIKGSSLIRPEAVEQYLRLHGHPRAILQALVPLAASVQEGLKSHGYGRPLRARFVEDDTARDVVLRTMAPDAFGHDRRADRIDGMVQSYDTFGLLPHHIRPLDVGVLTTSGILQSVGEGEPFLLTDYVEGQLYAHDLTTLAGTTKAPALAVDRARALADYLAELHRTSAEPALHRRAIRDLVGHGEGIMGLIDAYESDDRIATPARLQAFEKNCIDWRHHLRAREHRACRTHGDFHPFNILFREGSDFSVLDASRGAAGDAADDVTALSINYLFFALSHTGRFEGSLRELWDVFWKTYLDASQDRGLLSIVAPFFAWRSLVLACPAWYPRLDDDTRNIILRFAERLLAHAVFSPQQISELLAP